MPTERDASRIVDPDACPDHSHAPDGSTRRSTPAHRCSRRARHLAAPGRRGARREGRRPPRRSVVSAHADARVQIVTQQVARGARALPPLDRASDGRRRHVALSRRAVRHRSAIDEGFFYDFVVDRPFVPEDLDRIEAKMRELAAQDLPYERQMWPRDEAIDFFTKRGEPLKVQLIEEKTAGQSHVSCYTIKDRDTFVDFCVGPHVPSTNRLKAFKLLSTSNAYWKGDAKNQPMQRDLRHGVLLAEGARRAPEAPRGSEEARPPQASARSSGSSRSIRGRRARRSGCRRGRCSTTRSATTCAAC